MKDLNKINSLRDSSASPQNDAHRVTSEIVRQIILPEIEKEVNQGQHFANLRQIFNSLILATWYKKNLKTALLNQVYSDREKVRGIDNVERHGFRRTTAFPDPGGERLGDVDPAMGVDDDMMARFSQPASDRAA